MELSSLDPIWVSLCTGFLHDQLGDGTILLFDAPIALTRGSGLMPIIASTPAPNEVHPTTVPDRQATPSTTVAKPANSPTDPVDPPARTTDPVRDSPKAGDLARPASPPGDPITTPTNSNDPPAKPKTPQPNVPTLSAAPEDPTAPSDNAGDRATLANKGDPSSSRNVLPAGDSGDARNGKDNLLANKIDGTQRASADPKAPAQLPSQQEDGSQSLNPGLGRC